MGERGSGDGRFWKQTWAGEGFYGREGREGPQRGGACFYSLASFITMEHIPNATSVSGS